MKVSELFTLTVARSKSADDYDDGPIPFVTNTRLNNGVTKYVEPLPEDKQFPGHAICISGLGFATVQHDAFLPKGNGGDSATILRPIQEMTTEALIYYAALFNSLHRWRFSFGRKASKKRITDLELTPLFVDSPVNAETTLEVFSTALKARVEQYEGQFLVP